MLVLETFTPRPGRRLPDCPHPGILPRDNATALAVKRMLPTAAVLFAAENRTTDGEFHYQEILIRNGQLPRVMPGKMRYWWPEQIDELAAEAGLALAARYSDWTRAPYDPQTSPKHISLYCHAPG